MLETFELQDLNELIESEVRYFSAPASLHSVKIECFCGNGIKTSAQVCSNLPLPINALISNFDIKPCELSDSTPPNRAKAAGSPARRLMTIALVGAL